MCVGGVELAVLVDFDVVVAPIAVVVTPVAVVIVTPVAVVVALVVVVVVSAASLAYRAHTFGSWYCDGSCVK